MRKLACKYVYGVSAVDGNSELNCKWFKMSSRWTYVGIHSTITVWFDWKRQYIIIYKVQAS